jgi:hypothetical protein
MDYFKNYQDDGNTEKTALLQTIKIPKNLLILSEKLPQANYENKKREKYALPFIKLNSISKRNRQRDKDNSSSSRDQSKDVVMHRDASMDNIINRNAERDREKASYSERVRTETLDTEPRKDISLKNASVDNIVNTSTDDNINVNNSSSLIDEAKLNKQKAIKPIIYDLPRTRKKEKE